MISYGAHLWDKQVCEETGYRPKQGFRFMYSAFFNYWSVSYCYRRFRVWLHFGWGWRWKRR